MKIAAAGVNFIDVQHREGRYKPPALPFTVGSEARRHGDGRGAGRHEVAVGDRVAYAMVLGAYAEYAAVPARRLVRLPDAIGFETAAAVMLQGLHRALPDAQHVSAQSRRHGARARGGRRRGAADRAGARAFAAPPCTARSAARPRPSSLDAPARRPRSTTRARTSKPRSRSSRTAAASTSCTTRWARTRSTRA